MFAGGCGNTFVGAPAWIGTMESVHVAPARRLSELGAAATELTTRTPATKPVKEFNILAAIFNSIQPMKYELYMNYSPGIPKTEF
jgi:hypothetical protein